MMITSYSITRTGQLTDRYHLTGGLPKGVKPTPRTAPAELLPVVVAEDEKNTVKLMKWGFFTQGAKNANSVFRYKTFNARSEDVFKKPMLARVVRSQRCIVPADGFYHEVRTQTGKKTYYVHRTDDHMMSLAGLYSTWEDDKGTTWNTFTVVTTTANKDMRAIDKRMPVILSKDAEANWLNAAIGDMSSLYDMMRPYAADTLTINEAS